MSAKYANGRVIKGSHGIYVTTSARISQVANGPEVETICDRVGNTLAYRAELNGGRGYVVDTRKGRWRIHTRVKTDNTLMARDTWHEYHHHNLTRTLSDLSGMINYPGTGFTRRTQRPWIRQGWS